MYTLRQFARMFQLPEHTVRYYTDIGLLPCKRDSGNRRVFDEESVNWMRGIACLKGCGASIEDIRAYGELCKLPESRENLLARYQIILKQREQARKRTREAQAVEAYMNEKVKHYEDILAGKIQDDTNPERWTKETRPSGHRNPLQNC